jgi:NHLM bacteriocin system ABC transporter ATP-binding protein
MTDRATMQAARTGLRSAAPPPAGDRIPLDARRPRLVEERSALRLACGHADLFAVAIAAGAAIGARRHLCRIEAPALILGLPFVQTPGDARPIGLLAVGGQGAEAIVLDRALIERDGEALAAWIARLSLAIADVTAGWDAREAERGSAYELEAGQQLRAPSHGVAWIAVGRGEIALMGGGAVCRSGDPYLPLASGTWCEARGATAVRVVADAVPGSDPWAAIDRFHALAMACVVARMAAAQDAESARLSRRAARAATQGARLVDELSSILTQRSVTPRAEGADGADPLLDACRIAAAAIDARITAPPDRQRAHRGATAAAAIARASHLRSRRVLLRADWWRRDVGSFVAWRSSNGAPVAVVPIAPNRHLVIDPESGARSRVTAALAAEFAPEAVMFYAEPPPLTGSGKILGFCLRHGYRDVLRILASAIGVGALSLAVPLITEVLIDSIIPRSEYDQLAFCALGLAMVAIGMAGFQAVQSIAALRLQSALDRILQAGILDRLLRLPVSFFRQFAAGDLTDRVLGIEQIRRIVTSHTIRGLLASVFALFSFALMFYFDSRLGLIAVALTLVRGAMIVVTAALRLRRERRHFELDGKVQGLVLQLLTGVGKLRVACAAQRALAVWARGFAAQKRQFAASQRLANWLGIFEAAFPTLATLAIFAGLAGAAGASGTAGAAAQSGLDTGQFLAFFAAFGQSLVAVGEMAAAIGETLVAAPRLSRLRPLVTEEPELAEQRNPPGELDGSIELGQVTFRYAPGGPTILDKVTLQVGKGEYVAVVGPSGSGKSTLFRLLLGFEKPESGTIFFDGKAIDTLDITAIRRQIGVVLQNGKLASGSLYENICCGAQLPLERAWEAARLAGLDADVEAMPMGMHTVIAEGMNTLSGGQRQRLMIARALVHHPRILLFDEATSALDNRTQAIVSASVARLNVTRIVIAQRLSTVRSADRIVVLANGTIVQQGTFDALAAAPGLFAEFARRQLV